MFGAIQTQGGPLLALFDTQLGRSLADLVVLALACLGLYYLWLLLTGRAHVPGEMHRTTPPPSPGAPASPPPAPAPAPPPAVVAAPLPPVAAPPPPPAPAARVVSSRSDPMDAELVAVIAAAVATVLDRPHRVLEIKKAAPAGPWASPWAIEGRFKHYSSHKIR